MDDDEDALDNPSPWDLLREDLLRDEEDDDVFDFDFVEEEEEE